MSDILDKLADDIANSTIEICAKISEIHRLRHCENDYHNGYNQAVADIAEKIRELHKKGVAA